jgi:hypothetical protein
LLGPRRGDRPDIKDQLADPEVYFPALILTGSWYLNITVFLATGAALERRGPKLIDYPPGLVERTELIVFFMVLALLMQFGPWLCYAYTGLELITAAQRFLFARRMLSGVRGKLDVHRS